MKVKLLKNVKYDGTPYAVGETVEIAAKDVNEFVKKSAIDAEALESIEQDETDADAEEIAYDSMTKAQISELLDKNGVDYNARDTKDELLSLLLGND